MKVIIELIDDEAGAADVSINFDPPLTDETRDAPAARVAVEMIKGVAHWRDIEMHGAEGAD